MHLVGGFNDDRQLSQKLTNQLLSKFTFFPLSCPKKIVLTGFGESLFVI